MKMEKGLRGAAAGLALAFSAIGAYGAGKCEGDSARFRILPPTIGRPAATVRTPYELPCDSMIVPPGQTTIIYGSSVVNFGSGTGPGGTILVKGKLVIEGKPGNPAYLSGSVEATEAGFGPGDGPWIGIQADSGAILRISHARFYNASAALVVSSRDVVLKNCFFKGTSALSLPDTSLALNPMGQSLSSLDLREGRRAFFATGSGAVNGDGNAERGPRNGRAGKWLAGSVGVLAISGAAAWWALHPASKPHAAPVPVPAVVGLDAVPDLPQPAAAGP
jgi:hypothetical protein